MYTELVFASSIKKEYNKDKIVDTLKYMIEDNEMDKAFEYPEHSFFKTSRGIDMFHSGSGYFDMRPSSKFYYEAVSEKYYLNVICNLKNYDNEILLFLDWIYPYLNNFDGEFLGYFRYEEFKIPTFIFYGRDRIEFKELGSNVNNS